MIRRLLLTSVACVALTGCSMFDWATNNMPVIGQRCENWQCFTAGGQAQSKAYEEHRMHPAENPASAPGAPGTPIPGGAASAQASPLTKTVPEPAMAQPQPAPSAPSGEPLAEPTPEGGAYKYVPRAPAAPGTTPFEGAVSPAGPM